MLVLAHAALGVGAAPAGAQGVRGHLTGTARYIQIRPVRVDSIPFADATRRPDGSYAYQGRRVQCVQGAVCVFYDALAVEHAVTFTQNATATAWGLGVRGLSATVSLRARTDMGGAFTWPRSDDAFDAMLAYAELSRDRYRVRLGRMRTAGGLGFSSYDGASVWLRPAAWIRAEAYGGRSLARGLYEPRNEALRAVEDFVIDRNAYLVGGHAEVEPIPGNTVSVRYQREIWSDGSGLVSERASLDLLARPVRMFRLSGSVDYDVAFDVVGKAHLTLGVPLPNGMLFEVTGRRYRPYFELWTIWGFFDPVAYHEVDGRFAWSSGTAVALWLSGGYREYEDTRTQAFLVPLEGSTVRAAAGLAWTAAEPFRVEGTYRLERGAGATLSSLDVRARWTPAGPVGLGAHGAVFQQVEEYRLGEAQGWGGGVSVDVELTDRLTLDGGASLYRNLLENRDGRPDWSQVRGWTALRVDLGTDPGARSRRLRR